jgi:hypothetical protein
MRMAVILNTFAPFPFKILIADILLALIRGG